MRRNLPLLALALAACAEPSSQGAASCATPEARLAALGVDPADIEQIDIAVERANEGGILSRHAWVRLKSCTGYLVVRLDSSCSHSDPYTTGNCRLPQGRGV